MRAMNVMESSKPAAKLGSMILQYRSVDQKLRVSECGSGIFYSMKCSCILLWEEDEGNEEGEDNEEHDEDGEDEVRVN